MDMVSEDDDGCVDRLGTIAVQEIVAGAGSCDCGTCASRMASDVPVCVTASFPGNCAAPLGCCITAEGVAFVGDSTDASAKELEGWLVVSGSVDTGMLGIGRLSCCSRYAKTIGRRTMEIFFCEELRQKSRVNDMHQRTVNTSKVLRTQGSLDGCFKHALT